jgi:hypothetical protein
VLGEDGRDTQQKSPAWFQHASNFANRRNRIGNMLKHLSSQDNIHRRIGERHDASVAGNIHGQRGLNVEEMTINGTAGEGTGVWFSFSAHI